MHRTICVSACNSHEHSCKNNVRHGDGDGIYKNAMPNALDLSVVLRQPSVTFLIDKIYIHFLILRMGDDLFSLVRQAI